MKGILHTLGRAAICLLVFTLICGVIYPAAVTGIAQLCFNDKANGSLLPGGTGSELIGQQFTEAKYLIGRPQGVTNLSTVSVAYKELIARRTAWLDSENTAPVPAMLLTSSGSGVDPYISPEAAEYQVSRIAKARGLKEQVIEEIIQRHTAKKLLGLFGEDGVNVLLVNLSLDKLQQK